MNLKTVRRRVALGVVGLLVAAGGAIASSGPAYAAVACK